MTAPKPKKRVILNLYGAPSPVSVTKVPTSVKPFLAAIQVQAEPPQKIQRVTPPIPAAVQQQQKSTVGALWVDKYCPQKSSDIIMSASLMKQLDHWLRAWIQTGKPPNDKPQRAILISGPPGIGKTTVTHVLARELGFTPVEFNASVTRTKKTLEEELSDMIYCRSVNEFMGKKQGKVLLIMDEVDGMSSDDRGGIAALIQIIKKTKAPIICICNDRTSTKIRSLANFCLDLAFAKPTADQIGYRLTIIAKAENMVLSIDAGVKIAKAADCDVRQAINMLYMLYLSFGSKPINSTSLTGDLASTSGKDRELSLGPFEATTRLLCNPAGLKMADKMQCYFADYNLVPLLIHENYHTTKPRPVGKRPICHMDAIARAADLISQSDRFSQFQRQGQWELMNEHALMSCIYPAYYVQGQVGRTTFPAWFAKNSTTKKNTRLLQEVQAHMRAFTNVTREQLVLDYFPMLRPRVLDPLLTGAQGVDTLLDFMDKYGITREDWDTIITVGRLGEKTPDLAKKIAPVTRSAFTRKYHARLHGTAPEKKKKEEDLEEEEDETL
jgi:replication factor C subunit 1